MRKYYILLTLFFIGLVASAIRPHDYFTWFLEVVPALLALIALALTFNKFKFSTFTYSFIVLHCYILFIGGHYTYAEVPLFDWIRDVFHQSRNNYDKVGHFMQGFVPAMVIRELFLRNKIVKAGGWLGFVTISVCLAISAIYELVEWFVAVATGEAADSFLGTQGYVWDTQSDMLMALIGATTMVLLFSKIQDKQINRTIDNLQ
jgi:putative membrane protein